MSDSDVKEENMKLDYLKNHKSEVTTHAIWIKINELYRKTLIRTK